MKLSKKQKLILARNITAMALLIYTYAELGLIALKNGGIVC